MCVLYCTCLRITSKSSPVVLCINVATATATISLRLLLALHRCKPTVPCIQSCTSGCLIIALGLLWDWGVATHGNLLGNYLAPKCVEQIMPAGNSLDPGQPLAAGNWGLQKGMQLCQHLDFCPSDSYVKPDFQNYKIIHLWWLKPLILWEFVTAVENSYATWPTFFTDHFSLTFSP